LEVQRETDSSKKKKNTFSLHRTTKKKQENKQITKTIQKKQSNNSNNQTIFLFSPLLFFSRTNQNKRNQKVLSPRSFSSFLN
jgi:hypothetical protein